MKKLIAIVCCVLTVVSCGQKNVEEKKVERPANVVNRETMISLITDLALFEASKNLNLIQPKDSTGRVLAINQVFYQNVIYKKYGLTPAQFDSSYLYYSQRPEEMDSIYQKAITEMSNIQAEVSR